jgi:D-glycero-D-manno-heptose 1,7-bisphosphate phosphatase
VSGRPAVFLDRDGVLNRAEVRDGKPYAPRRPQDFRLLPGSGAAVRALREAGFLVIVVTNQPDIGNGHVSREDVEAMHAALRRRVPVDAIEMCPHAHGEGCACRKPRPGLLMAAAERLAVDLHRSFLVGDRAKDIDAGRAAGCYTVFVDRGYHEPRPSHADAVVASLPAAVRRIIAVATTPRNGEGRG